MNRWFTHATLIVVMSVAVAIAQTDDSTSNTEGDIEALKRQRVSLLRQRCERLESFTESGLIPQLELTKPEIDLLNAQIEYATDVAEKRQLYTELLSKYDILIEFAIAARDAHLTLVQPGKSTREGFAESATDYLYLKAERVRIQIQRDSL